MKYLAYCCLVILQTCFIPAAIAEESTSTTNNIPTLEKDFVSSINKFTKEQIIAQFGDRQGGSFNLAISLHQYCGRWHLLRND